MARWPAEQVIGGVLSPFERSAEVLFGIIMALAMTGALTVLRLNEHETRAMFYDALACNVAWGVVDAVMYVLNALFERGRSWTLAGALREDPDGSRSTELLSEVLPEPVVRSMSRPEIDALRRSIVGSTAFGPARLHRDDLIGAIGVFLLVVVSTFPVALPFLLIQDHASALLVSRTLSLLLLFFLGLAVGRYAGLRPVRVGLAMLGIGTLLVGVVIALGG